MISLTGSKLAPCKVLIYAPLRDRFTDPEDIKNCVEVARKAWKEKDYFQFNDPDDICRFQKDQKDMLIEWLGKMNK